MATTIINLSSLDGSNGFRLDGVAKGDRSGFSVSNAGDVNGDGFGDVIIGADSADPNGERSGSSYVVFGKAFGFDATFNLSSLDGSNGFRLDGEAADDSSGRRVSSAGDVNGDGFDDVLVGADHADPSGIYGAGSSYVVFGKVSGFAATLDLSSLDGNNGFRLNGEAVSDRSGNSVSNAGDVNGDGFADVIIGASYAAPNGIYNAGASYVVFGRASGFAATLDLSSLDGNNGFRLNGEAGFGRSGNSVSDAGDVNGDGFDDVIVGAPNSYGQVDSSSYVVFGKAAGFSAALDLSSLDGSNGFRLDARARDDGLGYSVSSAGDVNGDGFDDVIVSAYGINQNYDISGSSYVVFGKASGFEAALDLDGLDGSNGFRMDGTIEGRPVVSVSSAGDVNGDGFADVVVGASHASPNGNFFSGSSCVVFGKAGGFSATVDLSNLDSNSGFRLDGVTRGDTSGDSVSSAGDVNGDGFDDLIVGALGAGPNGDVSGSSYVVFGRSNFGGDNVIAGTPGDDILKGTPAAETFEAGDGNDQMIGRGGADTFKAGAGNDKITVADLDFTLVDGGAGNNDVLHLAGNGLNLNLADSGASISGIETLCLFGKGDNTLTLTAEGLLNLSDTSNTLRVNGNDAGHIIVEDSGWVDGGDRGSGYYHVYTHDDAVLLVGQNVTVDFA
ncbi:FG-GAP repeat protein [Nitrosomonas sp. Nm84]|uniref:integrin alpha n=1 Tax=Nitrosomonas sp. Nm84 TaxID=200124 RepID=UPI000D765364|nr:integrin alpha [Nitrosomonas sp. Nm84]PXW89858.1 FG-GAP repeat protein [Nitrosomonas sp. Nm84]